MIKNPKIRALIVVCSIIALSLLAVGCGSNNPSGTYSNPVLGMKNEITFKGDNVIRETILGTAVYNYEIRPNGSEIILTNVANGKSEIHKYKYIKDSECVVLDTTSYYKK
jgi:hypothetical protein